MRTWKVIFLERSASIPTTATRAHLTSRVTGTVSEDVVPQVWVVDDGDAGFSANWTTYVGAGFQGDFAYKPVGSGTDAATWTFSGLSPGQYLVSVTWQAYTNRTVDAPYAVLDGSAELATVLINQREVPADFFEDGQWWQNLGEPYELTGDTLVVRLSDLAGPSGSYLVADAVRIERVGELPALVTVLDVTGLPQADAEAGIEASGLTVGTVTSESSAQEAGIVISLDPVAGSVVAPGSAVDLVISLGPVPPTVANFHPVADAYVDEDHPDENKGSDDRLKIKAEAGKERISYLRFDAKDLSGNVSKALLYLFAKKDSNAGFEVYTVVEDKNPWGEYTITYNNAPPLGELIAYSGPTRNDTWTAIDVTSLVTGPGVFSLALVETGKENEFVSREKDQAPLLVVETLPYDVPPPPALLDILTLNPVADAYVDEDHPDENKGSDDRLKIKAEAGKERISYLRFDAQGLVRQRVQSDALLVCQKGFQRGL